MSKFNPQQKDSNLHLSLYPNHFIHGLLSLHVYKDYGREGDRVAFINSGQQYEEEKYNVHLHTWKVEKIFNDESSGYYGTIYVNASTKQAILAHRGTKIKFIDLFKKDSAIQTDLKGIQGGTVVDQQFEGYSALKVAIRYANEEGYKLSVTGHSLGAWLAELSVYFSHKGGLFRKSDGEQDEIENLNHAASKIKAITFDSPGSAEAMEQFQSTIKGHHTKFDLKIAGQFITNYLSEPNFINSSHEHIGKIYLLEEEMLPSDKEAWEKMEQSLSELRKENYLYKTLAAYEYLLDGILSVVGHKMNSLLEKFNPNTGKPFKYIEMLDWPAMKYTPKGGTTKSLSDAVFSLLPVSDVLKSIGSNILSKVIPDIALFNLISIAGEIVSGNLDMKQYWSSFKYSEKKSNKDLFYLENQGHFKENAGWEARVNLNEDTMLIRAGLVDSYIDRIFHSKEQKLIKKLPEDVNEIMKLKSQYRLEEKHGKKFIVMTKSTILTVEDLRERVIELIQEKVKIKECLEKDYTSLAVSGEFSNTKAFTLSSYLLKEPLQNYIDRKLKNGVDVFTQLDEILSTNQCVVINAIPGTGKSSAALKYGAMFKEAGKIVRWFDAASREKIEVAYRNTAKELGIFVDSREFTIIMNQFNSELAENKQNILFIFDNVEKYEDIKDLIANALPSVKILITTNHAKLKQELQNVSIKLEQLKTKEVSKYLQKEFAKRGNIKDYEDLAFKISSKKGEVLAYRLGKVEAYLKTETAISIREYISKFEALNNDRAETTLLIKLLDSSLLSWQLLQYAARLDPDFISLEIFKEIFRNDDQGIIQKAIDALESLSAAELVWKQDGVPGLRIEELTQHEVLKFINRNPRCSLGANDVIISSLISCLNKMFPSVTDDPNIYWQQAQLIFPHLNKLIKDSNSRNEEVAIVNSKLALYYRDIMCDYERLFEHQKIALEILQEMYSTNANCNYAASLINFGCAYKDLGNARKGLPYLERGLEMSRKLYPGNNCNVATSLNDIGIIHNDLGNVKEALRFGLEALDMRRNIYQDCQHPDIAISLNNVGLVYNDLGKLKEGLKYLKNAYNIRIELYGDDHPAIANSLNNISLAYKRSGKFLKGLKYQEKACEMVNKLYKGNHPAIASSFNYLSVIYLDLGEITRALVFGSSALQMFQELYKGNHPDIATSLNTVGIIYGKLGCHEEALNEYLEPALTMLREIYQDNHPDIAIYLYNIGRAHENLGNTWKGRGYKLESEKMQKALGLNPVGNGIEGYDQISYWNQYARDGIEELLKLRLDYLGIKDVSIKRLNYVWEEYSNVIIEVCHDIGEIIKTESETVLLPLNLYGKHWVGIAFNINTSDKEVTITYLDSEQNAVPNRLKEVLLDATRIEYMEYDITWVYEELEMQRSNNCGPETVENFIWYITGIRVPQEEAVALHSKLLEDMLLLGEEAAYC